MAALIRVLSIDGGGVRGLVAASILATLEAMLQSRTDNPDARIADIFDLVAGTSTGGFLACAYLTPASANGRPRYSGRAVMDMYRDLAPEIFRVPVGHRIKSMGGLGDERYPTEGIESVLQRLFDDRWLSDLLKPSLVTAYDIQRRRAMFFTSHDAVKRQGKDFLVRDVCRATTAAPTYFEAALIRSRSGVVYPLVDGGVFANNPTLCAYTEVRTHFTAKATNVLILSVGTGREHQSYSHGEAKDWGAVGWLRPALDIMMSSSDETVDFECSLAFNAPGGPQRYLRVDTDMARRPKSVSGRMDDPSPRNLAWFEKIGVETAEHRERDLDHFLDLALVESGLPDNRTY